MSKSKTSVQALRRSVETPAQPNVNVQPPPYPWATRIVLPCAILGTAGALLLFAGYDTIAPAQPVRVSPVVQKSASGPQLGSAVVQAAGWVEPDPFEISASALADGIVEQVLVLESEQVEKGQVLARLVDDDAKIEMQQAEAALALAEAELKTAQAELAAAQSDWDNPVELERAAASTTAQLKEARARLNQIDAELRAESAVLAEAERTFKRDEELFRVDDVGTQELVDKERARFQSQQAKVQAKRSEHAKTIAEIERMEAEVEAAAENYRLRTLDRERLEKAQAALARAEARVDVARADVDEKALQLERMEVRSPADGIVLRRLTVPGAKVVRMMDDPNSSHVVHLYDPEKLQVRVDVALADAALVFVGQQAEVSVEVFPDKVFRGKVSRVTHEANIQKNTIEAQVAITDPPTGLRPEMLARVKFLSEPSEADDSGRAALYAPRSAIAQDENGAYAIAVEDIRADRGVARVRPVETRSQGGTDWVQIVAGLKAGDRLVVNPPPGLSNGARVQVMAEVADDRMEINNGTD